MLCLHFVYVNVVLTCEHKKKPCSISYIYKLIQKFTRCFQGRHSEVSHSRNEAWLFKTQGTVRVLEPVQHGERTQSSPCDCVKEGATRGSKLHHVPKHQVTRQQQFIELEWKHLSSPDRIPLPVLFTSLLSGGKAKKGTLNIWPSVTPPTFHFLTDIYFLT